MRAVQNTAEWRRICAIPRRIWTEEEARALAVRMTAALKTSNGTMELWPIQALALAELGMYKGLLAPIGVGAGKTLISFLAGTMLDVERIALIVPAALANKADDDYQELSKHWKIKKPDVISYDKLSMVKYKEWLNEKKPQLVVADEGHRIKNSHAAVTRRVMRYLWENSNTIFADMSGTMIRDSVRNFAHLGWKALGDNVPVPRIYSDINDWDAALCVDVQPEARLAPGVLGPTIEEARVNCRKRIIETPGVVASQETAIDCSLIIRKIKWKLPSEISNALSTIRDSWSLPNGVSLLDRNVDVRRHSREISLGFFYKWTEKAPNDWLAARQAWSAQSRHIATHNQRSLDSQLEIIRAVDEGLYPNAKATLDRWREIETTFHPKTEPEWISKEIFQKAQKWQSKEQGIVWIEHTAWGECWTPFYGEKGLYKGQKIEHASGGIGASVHANATGRNLQKWNKNLIVSPPKDAQLWQQLLGRTHRPGQKEDEVYIDVNVSTPELEQAFEDALAGAKYIQDMTGEPQKLLLATIVRG